MTHTSLQIPVEQLFLPQKGRIKKSFVQLCATFSKTYHLLISTNTTDVKRKNDFKRFITTKTALMKKCQKKKYKTFSCS